MGNDVTDEMSSIFIGHYFAVKVAGLDEVVIRELVRMAIGHTRNIHRRHSHLGIGSWTAEAVWPVIGASSLIRVNAHGAIPLITVFLGCLRCING